MVPTSAVFIICSSYHNSCTCGLSYRSIQSVTSLVPSYSHILYHMRSLGTNSRLWPHGHAGKLLLWHQRRSDIMSVTLCIMWHFRSLIAFFEPAFEVYSEIRLGIPRSIGKLSLANSTIWYFARPCPTSSALTLPIATCNPFQYNNIPTLFIAVMPPRFSGCSIYLQAVGQGDLVITGFICSLFMHILKQQYTDALWAHGNKGKLPSFLGLAGNG